MTQFVDLAANRDAVGFKNAFDQAIAEKIGDALDIQKIELAATMFNSVDEAYRKAGDRPKTTGAEDAKELNRIHGEGNFGGNKNGVSHAYLGKDHVDRLRNALHTHPDKGRKLYNDIWDKLDKEEKIRNLK